MCVPPHAPSLRLSPEGRGSLCSSELSWVGGTSWVLCRFASVPGAHLCYHQWAPTWRPGLSQPSLLQAHLLQNALLGHQDHACVVAHLCPPAPMLSVTELGWQSVSCNAACLECHSLPLALDCRPWSKLSWRSRLNHPRGPWAGCAHGGHTPVHLCVLRVERRAWCPEGTKLVIVEWMTVKDCRLLASAGPMATHGPRRLCRFTVWSRSQPSGIAVSGPAVGRMFSCGQPVLAQLVKLYRPGSRSGVGQRARRLRR